jgi:hypothetical protein
MGQVTAPPRVSDRLPSSIQDGLDAMHQALIESPGEMVSERFAEANERLFAAWRTVPCRLVHASELSRRPQGRMILDRIVEDPLGCARSWNDAVRIVPRSARALRIDEQDPEATEVPIWTVDPESLHRRPGTLRDLRTALAGEEPILPRAFLMTTMIRSDGFETMVHGTGGGRYEPVTDHWARTFLGLELPPIEVATATVRLPLEALLPAAPQAPTPEEIRRLEHDPWPSPDHKRALLARIDAAEHGSSERQRRYVEMQAERTREQAVIAGRLQEMRTRFEATSATRTRQAIGEDRTWAWPLHDPSTLEFALSSSG